MYVCMFYTHTHIYIYIYILIYLYKDCNHMIPMFVSIFKCMHDGQNLYADYFIS